MQERRTQLLCIPVVLCPSCVQVILCLNGVEEHAIGSVMAYTTPESVQCSSSVMGCTDHLTVNTRGVEDLGANVWIRAVQDQVRTNLRSAVCRTCCCSNTHTRTCFRSTSMWKIWSPYARLQSRVCLVRRWPWVRIGPRRQTCWLAFVV